MIYETRVVLLLLLVIHVATVFSYNDFIECGNPQKLLDNCFRDLPSDLKEFLLRSKIPMNEKDIASKCTIFRQGIGCFDDYTDKCLDSEKLELYQNNVFGAREFLNKLCSNRKFQTDYLRHKDCFLSIEDDWRKCTNNFHSLLKDELHDSSKKNSSRMYIQFCCSRYAHENCVFNSAKYKCQKNSAKFVKKVARLLSNEKHFHYCRQYENLLCSGGNFVSSNLWSLIFGVFFINRFYC